MIIAAFIGFAIIITIRKMAGDNEGPKIKSHVKSNVGIRFRAIYCVTLSLVAVRYTTGIVSSISSILHSYHSFIHYGAKRGGIT